jgi:Tfp pilus assembly protein FimV
MSVLASGVAGSVVRVRPAGRVERQAMARPVGMRLTRRGRVAVATLASVVGLCGTFASERAVAGQAPAAIPVETRTVTAGETLWDVARSYAEPGEDIRDVVDHLIELNGLAGGGVRAGQELLVPAP